MNWKFLTRAAASPLLWLLSLPVFASTTARIDAPVDREHEPVTLRGDLLPELLGRDISEIAAFRYDTATGSFEPIAYQIDERVDHVFDPGSATEFTEKIYDVFQEDDGLLDGDDEVVFLFGDGGDKAPAGTEWPAASEPQRFEIEITDPRAGTSMPSRWFYLYTGTGLPTSPTTYVSWSRTATTPITTTDFELDYAGNWLLDGYRVLPPCGSGFDLIDRFKGRALVAAGVQESEEDWNQFSTFLGGIAGPVRAIRYVRGAASGVNTIHHDVVSKRTWVRRMNVRVHPLPAFWFYFDWLPATNAFVYTPNNPSGIPADGVPDTGIGNSWVPWSTRSGPGGGLNVQYDIPDSPLYTSKEFHYLDDASHDDTPPNRSYFDEDDSAYGNHGFKVNNLTTSDTDLVFVGQTVHVLCSNEGDGSLGGEYEQLSSLPLQPSVIPQWTVGGPVRTLSVIVEGSDVRLDWLDVTGSTSYRIYHAPSPDLPRASWSLLAEIPGTSYLDTGEAMTLDDRFYSVVSVTPGGEGPW